MNTTTLLTELILWFFPYENRYYFGIGIICYMCYVVLSYSYNRPSKCAYNSVTLVHKWFYIIIIIQLFCSPAL
jgi:hypothetical protein